MGVRKEVKKMVLSEAREKLRLGVKVPEVEEEEEQVGPVVAGWRGSKYRFRMRKSKWGRPDR